MRFTASCITWQNENGVVLLGFADDEFNTTQYLLLQRTLGPDQQDRDLGMDRLYIELNDQARSAYGTVEEARLRMQGVTFRLDQATAATVSNGESIEIAFDVTAARLQEMAEQLRLLTGPDRVHVTPDDGMST